MESINRDILVPYMAAYKTYLDRQAHGKNARPLSNEQEDYKRRIPFKATETLDQGRWSESDIGTGSIGEKAIRAVQKNRNLVGRFQVTAFSDKVKDNPETVERILFDLYCNRKDRECFDRLCDVFGRKYDLLAYLYFILDPNSYLPLRSSIFDKVFKKLKINLQTSGRCSWENYQYFLNTVAHVRDVMKEYYQTSDVDLLDAHSFLWTLNLNVLKIGDGDDKKPEIEDYEKRIEAGAAVFHKRYGEGIITNITEEKIYAKFNSGLRIFNRVDAFEKGYLTLI